MRIPIMNLDTVGILQDTAAHDLPLAAWSSGKNVTFVNGRVEKAKGYRPSFTPEHDIRFMMPVRSPAGYFWLSASNSTIYNYTNALNTNISRDTVGPYHAEGQTWTGGSLNGIPILNNPKDEPQMWLPASQNTLMTALQNWPSGWRALSLRPFGYFLVALGTTKGVEENPYRVNWSHPAAPGQVPITWDIADETRDAGETVIADTDGTLVDQLPLSGANIIYKSDSVHAMNYIGGNDIFSIRPLLPNGTGLLVPNGVVKFNHKGAWHAVLGPNDFYVHQGTPVSESPLRKRMRDWLYNNIDPSFFVSSYLAHNIDSAEIWICFPETGNLLPNLALVWNYKDNTTTVRELPQAGFICTGRVTDIDNAGGNDSWSASVGSWNTDSESWGFGVFSAVGSRMLMATHGAARKAYVQNAGTQFNDTNFMSFVERVGLSILGQDKFSGKPIYDSDAVKTVIEVWPRMQAGAGTVCNIYLGTQMKESDPIKWTTAFPFRIGVDQKINPYVSGKIISIRFEVESNTHWQLSGYDLEVVGNGQY